MLFRGNTVCTGKMITFIKIRYMEKTDVLVKQYRVYKLLDTNVFGITALVHGLGNTFTSFTTYSEAEEWQAIVM